MRTRGKNPVSIRYVVMAAALFLPFISWGATSQGDSYFSNALFNTLLLVIVLLAVIVIGLAGALRSFIASDLFVEKLKKDKTAYDTSAGTKGLLIFLLMGGVSSLKAQQMIKTADNTIGGLDQATFYTMITVIAIEVLVLGILISTFKDIAGRTQRKKVALVKKPRPVLDKINKTVPIEEEGSITLDHNYDGIRELDNDLPPWWKYGFYVTIVVAVVYMIAYHVTGSLPLQVEEYKASMRQGEAEVAEYMKNSANNVDETTVKLLTEKADLDSGRDIFIATCSACHGRSGEGGVGPNLTDDYWLHQGGVSDIFRTIKYGNPDKGMKAWKDDFSPVQIAQLTSFIKTLRGTNPPNGKEKQGELFTEAAIAPDSLHTSQDTLPDLTSQVLK